jgi:hypothetical protein
VSDTGRVVQREHRVEPSEAGRDHLWPTGEPGEEVRLDKPGGDPDIGRAPLPVQPHRHVVAQAPTPLQRSGISSIVVDDADTVDNVIAEHGPKLCVSVRPMSARCHEYHHVVEPNDSVQLVEQRPQHRSPRLRSSDIAGRDRHRLARRDTIAERLPGNRLSKCLPYDSVTRIRRPADRAG